LQLPTSGETGTELTVRELEEMACRQQHQIESQRQLLAAKEQRLRYLKQHDTKHHQVAAEHERLRRLRDRVEAQEQKLRKLRALRGQVDQTKLNNATLSKYLYLYIHKYSCIHYYYYIIYRTNNNTTPI
jgi:apoptosis-stimulating of p53 protein 1